MPCLPLSVYIHRESLASVRDGTYVFSESDECPICFNQLCNETGVQLYSCGHCTCQACASVWVGKCPECRMGTNERFLILPRAGQLEEGHIEAFADQIEILRVFHRRRFPQRLAYTNADGTVGVRVFCGLKRHIVDVYIHPCGTGFCLFHVRVVRWPQSKVFQVKSRSGVAMEEAAERLVAFISWLRILRRRRNVVRRDFIERLYVWIHRLCGQDALFRSFFDMTDLTSDVVEADDDDS